MIARLTLSYVGTTYSGWQRQPAEPTVQAALEAALTDLVGTPVTATGAGRTDAGVHARGQVASVRLDRDWPNAALVHGTNQRLPATIRVHEACAAAEDFDARRSALAKHYRYALHRGTIPTAGRAPFVAWERRPLDLERLRAATRCLPGEHDFEVFSLSGRAPGPTRRRIFSAAWRENGAELHFTIVGEGFLRGMVRRLVGSLLDVGAGRLAVDTFAELLAGGDRALAGPTAPARGLCLDRVDYPTPRAGPAGCLG